MAVGDLNQDGKQDIVVADQGSDSISLLIGNGDGTFVPRVILDGGTTPGAIGLGDYNGDGFLDIACTNWDDSNTVSILLGQGDGTFRDRTAFATGHEPFGIAVGDVNSDGISDLVVGNFRGTETNSEDSSVSVLLGLGDGTFGPQHKFAIGSYPVELGVVDLNHDGRLDVVVTNAALGFDLDWRPFGGSISVLLNSFQGDFTGDVVVVDQSLAAPTALISTPGNGQVTLSWTAPSSNGSSPITEYVIRYSADEKVTWSSPILAGASPTSLTIPGLVNGHKYWFEIAAKNAAGVGSYSAPVSATPEGVPDAPPPPTAAPDPIGISPLIIPGKLPTPPIGVDAVPVEGGVLVWWGYTRANPLVPSDPKLPWINHDVEYSVDGTTWTAVIHTPSPLPFQYVPTTLHGKALIFRVRGINGYGAGSYGYSGNYVIPGTVASPALQYISLAAPVSDGGRPIIGYMVQVSYDNGTTWKTATSGGPLFNSPFEIAPISDLFAHNAPARDNRITALDWDRPFVLRSAAVNQLGISAWSLPSNIFNKGTAPTPTAVPSATVAIDKGTPTVSLSDVPHGAIAVFIRKTGDTLWSVSDVRGYDTTQFVVPNLDAGLSYDVKIQALNGWGLSVPYSELSVSIPYVPGISSTISGNGSVSVAWTGPVGGSGSPITDYLIQYSSNGGLSWTPFSDGKSTLTTATVTGLANGTSYVFRVAAVNDTGTGSWSVNSSAVIPCTVPAAPTNVIGEPGNSQAVLSWTAPLDNGGSPITDYVIQYSNTGSAPWTTFPHSASTATSATVTGLTNGTSYVFRVAAVNAAGTGSWSNPVTVIPRTVPAAPISLIGTTGNGQVSLSWTAPANNGGSAITDYTIQYSTNGGATWTISSHSASTATTATVTGLTNGTSYVFRVAAVNAAGTGAFSDPTPRATPLPAVPGRPTAAAGNGFVILRWAAPRLVRMPPITDYAIRYSSDNGSTWTLYPHIASAATSRRLILTNGNTYIFQVAPVVSGGVGVYSARSLPVTPFSPAAKPDAPSGVVGVKTGALISLSWNPVPRNAGGPVIDYLVQYRVNTPKARWVTYPDLVSPATSANILLKRLQTGSSYVFRVAAKNLAGVGAYSAQSAPVTAFLASISQPPSSPLQISSVYLRPVQRADR